MTDTLHFDAENGTRLIDRLLFFIEKPYRHELYENKKLATISHRRHMENYRRWDISRTATNIFVHQNRLSFCKPVAKRPYPDTYLRTDLQHATVDYSHSCHPVRHRTRIRLRRINGNTAPQRCCKPAEWTYYFVDKLLSGACPKWNIYRNRFNHVIMDVSYTDR